MNGSVLGREWLSLAGTPPSPREASLGMLPALLLLAAVHPPWPAALLVLVAGVAAGWSYGSRRPGVPWTRVTVPGHLVEVGCCMRSARPGYVTEVTSVREERAQLVYVLTGADGTQRTTDRRGRVDVARLLRPADSQTDPIGALVELHQRAHRADRWYRR